MYFDIKITLKNYHNRTPKQAIATPLNKPVMFLDHFDVLMSKIIFKK